MTHKHIIEIIELNEEYSYWSCDCGAAGSCPSPNVDVAAERHIPDDELAVYRYPSKDSRA